MHYFAAYKGSQEHFEILRNQGRTDKVKFRKSLIGNKYHLGELKQGWQFYFNSRNYRFFCSIQGLNYFVFASEITDEDGKILSGEEFLELVDRNQNKLNHKKLMTELEHHLDKDGELDTASLYHSKEVYKSNSLGEEFIDGLRFCTLPDFNGL